MVLYKILVTEQHLFTEQVEYSIMYYRSGSCPADSNNVMGAEGNQHHKTGSFDSTVPLLPQQKPHRPKPLVREK